MDHEAALIEAFVQAAKKSRLLASLRSPRRRPKAVKGLNHFGDLDSRFMVEIPPAQQKPASIARLLQQRGAPNACHVVSSDPDLDGRDMPLLEALERIVGFGSGTLLSCVPGRLAYFEGEAAKDRFILQRDRA